MHQRLLRQYRLTCLLLFTGAFALGLLVVLVVQRWQPTRYVRPFAAIGICGGYTTWSTFMVDTVLLVREDRPGLAVFYLVAGLVAGLAATCAGIALGRACLAPHRGDAEARRPGRTANHLRRGDRPARPHPAVHRDRASGPRRGAGRGHGDPGPRGYGASRHIHTTRILSLSEDLPMVIVIVDTPERIDAFLPALDELITEGLLVREPVEIVAYLGRTAP
jgi:fluoride ion exporter CrcB/FEX